MAYQDGNFTNAIQDGPARIFYPFINAATKDNVTKGTVRNYVVVPSSYTPAAALSTDPADNTQYLLNESELTVEGGLGRFSRTYCKVPTDQVDYSSIVINKPQFPPFNVAASQYFSFYGTSFIENALTTSNVYGTNVNCSATYNVSGGTFTVTYNGSTTASLNYNDSNATIAAAINGLAGAISNAITVTVTNNIANTYYPQLNISRSTGTNSISSLTASFSLTPDQYVNKYSGIDTFVGYFASRGNVIVTSTSHGLTNTSSIILYSIFGASGTNVKTGITITNVNAFTFVQSNTFFLYDPNQYRTLLRTYTPGTDRVLTKQTDKFYLPTITPGITTAADIPVPDVAINDTQLLDLIAASATGFQNYDAEPITGWPSDQSPVYRQRLIQINVDDL